MLNLRQNLQFDYLMFEKPVLQKRNENSSQSTVILGAVGTLPTGDNSKVKSP